ncbi:MAG: class I SAM-dependent methyltransferase [Candidatus Omnitrophica bacterium]|jgi:2-polyprenyl-3-methyl-5-hydroxy-6-metoxy-1,4-benzoquinol methylase|nr:class I SAM-dependent methyltransferase [Candidatus Omnitrophota bacterium]
MDKTKCELCGGSQLHALEQLPIHLALCKNCGLIFIQNVKPGEFYQDLYTKNYNFDSVLRKNLSIARWVKKNLGTKGSLKILEVGCGQGELLKLFKNDNFDLWGIEPGQAQAEIARIKHGLGQVECGFLANTKHPEKFFDIVLLIQTFEHFLEPRQSLLKLRSLLQSRGKLFLEVPNACSVVGIYRWGLAPSPNHLFIYTPATLKNLLEECGFKIIKLAKDFLNIRVVAEKTISLGKPKKYKNSPKLFLLINFFNKSILKVLYSTKIIEIIYRIRSRRNIKIGKN